jgi:hypothetical protein
MQDVRVVLTLLMNEEEEKEAEDKGEKKTIKPNLRIRGWMMSE